MTNLTIPISTGRSSVRANGGIVKNTGLEFYLNIRWVNRPDFTFSTSGNISRNKNVIVRSEYDYESYAEAISGGVLQGGVVNVVGKETGAIWGWKTAGVDPRTGNPMYYLTEDGKRAYAQFLDEWDSLWETDKQDYLDSGVVSSFAVPDYVVYDKDNGRIPKFYDYSMQYLGRSNPKYVGGFNTYLRWRNLEFSTQWSYKVGHIIPSFNDLQNAPNNWRDAEQAAIGYSSDLSVSGTNRERKYLSFWKTSGDVTDIPRFVTGDDYWAGVQTDAKYEKGNYLRLTNIAISYRLPVEVAQRFGMKNMSLSFNAYNLLTFTKYSGLDVGTNGAFGYPASREYNLKLSVGF